MARATVLTLLLAVIPVGANEASTCATTGGRERYEPRTFFGYACAQDCTDHKGGFAWAERHGITDPAACALASPRAADGCRAYAEQAVTAEQAGFDWASENEVTDRCLCGGAGRRFEAGCEAYLGAVPP